MIQQLASWLVVTLSVNYWVALQAIPPNTESIDFMLQCVAVCVANIVFLCSVLQSRSPNCPPKHTIHRVPCGRRKQFLKCNLKLHLRARGERRCALHKSLYITHTHPHTHTNTHTHTHTHTHTYTQQYKLVLMPVTQPHSRPAAQQHTL